MKILLFGVFIFLSLSGFTHASELNTLTDEELDHRFEFIKKRLDAQHDNAFWWQYGWEGIYAVSAASQAAAWSAAETQDEKVNFRVGALKSLAGFAAMHAKPLPGSRVYTAAVCDVCEINSRVYKIERLKQAEQALENRAWRAAHIHNIKRHGIGVIVNVLAGLYIAKHGDETDAIVSTVGGIISGEVNIFTQPTGSIQDWSEYQQLDQSKVSNAWNWKLIPTGHGLALNVQF